MPGLPGGATSPVILSLLLVMIAGPSFNEISPPHQVRDGRMTPARAIAWRMGTDMFVMFTSAYSPPVNTSISMYVSPMPGP